MVTGNQGYDEEEASYVPGDAAAGSAPIQVQPSLDYKVFACAKSAADELADEVYACMHSSTRNHSCETPCAGTDATPGIFRTSSILASSCLS